MEVMIAHVSARKSTYDRRLTMLTLLFETNDSHLIDISVIKEIIKAKNRQIYNGTELLPCDQV